MEMPDGFIADRFKEKRVRRVGALDEQFRACHAALHRYTVFWSMRNPIEPPAERDVEELTAALELAFGQAFALSVVDAAATMFHNEASAKRAEEVRSKSVAAMRRRVEELANELGVPLVELKPFG